MAKYRAKPREPKDISRLQRAAVLFHPERPRAVEAAVDVVNKLRDAGVEVHSGSAFDGPALTEKAAQCDLVLGLGGDGTILSLARHLAGTGVPVLGINLGRVGFLAELTPEGIADALPLILSRSFWIERRSSVEACWRDGDGERNLLALNEVAIARGVSTRAIRVAISIDGKHYTTHTADGVIVSTATGSTAYSLAAGGPILYPESQDLLITPVAPHLHIGRSILVPGGSLIGLTLQGDREAMLAIDGQTESPFGVGEAVTVRMSKTSCLFARLGERSYFYSVLAQRLH